MYSFAKYKLFIFDWDNTLVESPFLLNLTRYLKQRYWKKPEKIKISNERLDIAKMQRLEEESKVLSSFFDFYLFIQKPKPKPYSLELLSFLKLKHKKIAIFSDGKSERVLKEIHFFSMGNYVDFAMGANSIKRFKPDPAGLLYIMHKYKASRRESIYIGDMAVDIFTARLAGIDSCAIADGLDSISKLKEEKPTYLFETLSGFLRALKEEIR